MEKSSAKYGKGFEILFLISMVLCAVVGYRSGPCVYQYIEQWCIYTVIANCRSTFSALGIVTLDGIILKRSLVGETVRKIRSTTSRTAKILWILGLALLCLIFAWVSFAEGVAIGDPVRKSTQYQKGEIKDPDELKSDIYVTIVMEDGRALRDLDVQYEIVDVERVELSKEMIWCDLPRYFACQMFGAGPIKVTVKPLYPDVIVRFVDPLVSLGDKTIVQKHDPALLGNVPAEDQDDYSPTFGYNFVEIGEAGHRTICGVKNILEMQDKTVLLCWDNKWELSCRDVLNQQVIFAEAGETVDFYYPGERIVFDLDMIQNLENPDRTLSERLRGAGRFELSLELANADIVQYDKSLIDQAISTSDLPEQPECLVKTGPDIVYHCWAEGEDLGRYCIACHDGVVTWEAASEETPAVMLCLEIS